MHSGLYIRVVLPICLCLCLISAVSSQTCTDANLQKCFEFRDELLNISSGYFILKELSDDLIDDYCNIFQRVTKSCLEDLAAECNERTAARLQGLIDATLFLCTDGFEEFLNLKPCLHTADTQRQLLICEEQYTQDIKNTGSLDKDDDLKICEATEELIDCEADALENTCSEEAGQWTRTYNTYFYQPYMTVLKCTETTASPTTTQANTSSVQSWVIAVAVIGGVLFLIILVAVSVCLVRKSCNDKPPKQTSSQSQPQPAVTVIIDNRDMVSHKHHKHHSQQHHGPPKRLPRSTSTESNWSGSQADNNTYQPLQKPEDIRYHMDPTLIRTGMQHMAKPPQEMRGEFRGGFPHSAKPNQELGGTHGHGISGQMANGGFVDEGDYLHPVPSQMGSQMGSRNDVYEELPADNV